MFLKNMYLEILNKEKKKIIIAGIICVLLALLILSIYPKKKYSVEFTANIHHDYFIKYDIVKNVTGISDLINISKINSRIPIELTYQKISKTFVAKSNNQSFDKELEIIIRKAVEAELVKMFHLMKDLESNQKKYSTKYFVFSNGVVEWSIKDILLVDKESILDQLIINFGEVKKNYDPVIILVFAFILGMYISILYIFRSTR